jgi:hypothetical protein
VADEQNRHASHPCAKPLFRPSLARILLVEGDPRDVELNMTALGEYNLANEVVVARDGEKALDYLYCRGE